MSHLVSAAELSDLIDREPRLRVLDVRWRLGGPDGYPDYLDAHIPGAVCRSRDRTVASRPSR